MSRFHHYIVELELGERNLQFSIFEVFGLLARKHCVLSSGIVSKVQISGESNNGPLYKTYNKG